VAQAKLPRDLLARPAEEAVRRVALRELDRAETAHASLVAGSDPEALHDFRVALRRLRSQVRAFRDLVGDPLGRKLRRRVGDLADETNPGRDGEVALLWLEKLGGDWKSSERRGIEWLAARLASARDEAYRTVEARVVPRFGELAAALRERLARYRVEVRLDGDEPPVPSYGGALGAELRRHGEALSAALAAIASVADEEPTHRARIEAKRLRYLLEPAAARLAGGAEAVERLRALQDLLGDLRDLQVLAATVARAVAEAETERARRIAAAALAGDPDGKRQRAEMRRTERPGLLALARRIAARRDEVFAAFESAWLAEGAEAPRALAESIAALAERLAAQAA
jgi:CHAD domain-containing protein